MGQVVTGVIVLLLWYAYPILTPVILLLIVAAIARGFRRSPGLVQPRYPRNPTDPS